MTAREPTAVEAVLRDCREYFLLKAKATWHHGVEVPNEEMRLLYRIEQVVREG